MGMGYQLYTDGACQPNPGKGGWSFVLLKNKETIQIKTGSEETSTNNIMEMTAVIKGLEFFKSMNIKEDLTVYSDSKYVIDGINEWSYNWKKRGWTKKKGTIKNLELWKVFRNLTDELIKFLEPEAIVCFKHVPGHMGNEWNETCDTLAQKCAENKNGKKNKVHDD